VTASCQPELDHDRALRLLRQMVRIRHFGARPWVVDGAVARLVVTLSLSADHRVTSGHEGSRFLDAIAALLSIPEQACAPSTPTR
jgi:hypothetical protein